ncbi:hypothetical protein R6Q57_018297 [Mikania cordata]
MFACFFFRDHFPFMGWLDILNGNMARLEKNFKDLDEFYQELIDEHVNSNKPNNIEEDMVDILLKLKQESDSTVPLTYDHIKGVLMNILLGGTETSATTVVWAMTLLMKNPQSLKKVQQEVRNAIGNKGRVHEDDLYKLKYLKSVIKETYRLHPVVPLLIPHESRDRCVLGGYEIPKKTIVHVNAWAIGRDPECWERPEVFEPERFMGSRIDYKGNDYELIPFGSGRRGCPGMSLGATIVEVTLSNLVYSFDWELVEGMSDIDTLTSPGTIARKKNDLRLVAKVYDHGCTRFNVKAHHPLPPGPPGLPVIGNLHQLDMTSNLSDHLWRLSTHYGPLMSLRLGHVQSVVVSSAEMAKQVLKTNDLVFCSRPLLTGQQKLSYGNKDIAFSPYDDYWRVTRKTCTLHLFSMKQVKAFRPVREEEVFDMIDSIKTQFANKHVVNLSELLMILTSNIICRVAFGKRSSSDYNDEKHRIKRLLLQCQAMFACFFYRDHFPFMGWLDILNGSMGKLEKNFKDLDEFYQELIDEHLHSNKPNNIEEDMVDILLKLKQESDSTLKLTYDHIKAVLMNILLGGTETSATTVVWVMTLLMKNPQSLKKVQQEVRSEIGDKGRVHEDDLYKFKYLKAVIKETYRLHPIAPLLVPRESRERCVLGGYEIPKKTIVHVNAWAIGRDPECWQRPEVFEPERFMGSSIDYKGNDYGLIPFGSGRRGCPGMSLGATTVELALSNLVYSFDWELLEGMSDIDILTTPGTIARKKNDLRLLAKVYNHGCRMSCS